MKNTTPGRPFRRILAHVHRGPEVDPDAFRAVFAFRQPRSRPSWANCSPLRRRTTLSQQPQAQAQSGTGRAYGVPSSGAVA